MPQPSTSLSLDPAAGLSQGDPRNAWSLSLLSEFQRLLLDLHLAKAVDPVLLFRCMKLLSKPPEAVDRPGHLIAALEERAKVVARQLNPVLNDQGHLVAANERLYTQPELAEAFGVSVKTIQRWRKAGLMFVKVRRPEKRVERPVCSAACLEQYLHRERPREPSPPPAAEGLSALRVAARPPEGDLFPSHHTAYSVRQAAKVVAAFRGGAELEDLIKRYALPRQAINQILFAAVQELPLHDFTDSAEFHPAAPFGTFRYLREAAVKFKAFVEGQYPPGTGQARIKAPKNIPAYLAELYETPLLTREQEQYLFRKFNYLLYCANALRDGLAMENPRLTMLRRIWNMFDEAERVKNQIITANLRLVVSLSKRCSGDEDFFARVSDGNMSLMKAVKRFDYSRGNKFGTYASWAIKRNFAHSHGVEDRTKRRYPTGVDEILRAHPARDEETDYDRNIGQARLQFALRFLDERAVSVITQRFGLADGRPNTLEIVGAGLARTKERIRQIEKRSLKVLGEILEVIPLIVERLKHQGSADIVQLQRLCGRRSAAKAVIQKIADALLRDGAIKRNGGRYEYARGESSIWC